MPCFFTIAYLSTEIKASELPAAHVLKAILENMSSHRRLSLHVVGLMHGSIYQVLDDSDLALLGEVIFVYLYTCICIYVYMYIYVYNYIYVYMIYIYVDIDL
jgi:hypothetical protein